VADEIVLQGTGFHREWPVGFGIGGVDERDPEPLIRVAAVDLATGEEAWHDVHRGEPFEVAGQTWQVAEVRYGFAMAREVVLRRVA
jgi:Family of unknown function (DUF6406)